MATVKFTPALKRFFPSLNTSIGVEGQTVREILIALEYVYPGLNSYILDDQQRLRHHVNIFLNGALIADTIGLTDSVQSQDELFIIQALSGG